MTNSLIARAEDHDYQDLFIKDLNWSAPNHPPITYDHDGQQVTATNVSSYKGLRVWAVDQKPDSKLEAAVDRLIAETTTDRIVIFYDANEQVWRWPVRRNAGNTTTTRLTRHRHRAGTPDLNFAAKLDAIRLPLDQSLDPNAVLAKVRSAFDVEAHNETKHASKLMARLYTAMDNAYPTSVDPKTKDHQISVTLARTLFLMFGDDTDMWAQDLFRDFVYDHTASDGSDIGSRLTGLFEHLDSPPAQRADPPSHFDRFPYVNGRIFRERVGLPRMNAEFRTVVLEACDRDWSTISPAIFGSMFQSVRDATTRRELGEHYTSEENILKTLNPLFLDELRAEFEHIKTLGKYEADRLRKLRARLGQVRYMDPACGCGNFIIVAYRELRDLELAIMERLQEITGDGAMLLANVGLEVTLDHFYGIEIDEWPARIAETAMFLIDRQCDLKLTASLGWAPDRLPIQEHATIVVGNALRVNWEDVCPATRDVYVAGNPPFLGHKERSASQTTDLERAWNRAGAAHLDYVTAWFATALKYFYTSRGEWAFVSTNSVCQGASVLDVFKPIFAQHWTIKFAHRSFAWSSEASGGAKVHVIIVGFSKDMALKPRLFDYATPRSSPMEVSAKSINAYLVDAPNVLVAPRRSVLAKSLPQVRYGSMPNDGQHLLVKAPNLAEVMRDPVASRFVRRFVGADELLKSKDKWCLWLEDATREEISSSTILRQRVSEVKRLRANSRRTTTVVLSQIPHLFGERRQPSKPYVCIPRHVSENRVYFTVAHLGPDVICGDSNFTADDPDGFLFAVMSSTMFITWMRTIGGALESRLRFSAQVVWNTFPLPDPPDLVRRSVIEAGNRVLAARDRHPDASLQALYAPANTPFDLLAAHRELDDVVDLLFDHDAEEKDELVRQRLLLAAYLKLV